MKYSIILPFGFCLGEVMANIDFKIQVTLNCNPDDKAYTGCLRGQRCTEEWKYVLQAW